MLWIQAAQDTEQERLRVRHGAQSFQHVDGLYICILSSRACAAFAFGFPITAFLMARSSALVDGTDEAMAVETKNEEDQTKALCSVKSRTAYG
jgi:hypothetical protein